MHVIVGVFSWIRQTDMLCAELDLHRLSRSSNECWKISYGYTLLRKGKMLTQLHNENYSLDGTIIILIYSVI
jgi:hypothetical protein